MCGSWSSVIPTPLSQTSMRTLSPARRHPSRIRPLSVYRTAFDNRLHHLREHAPVAADDEPGTDDAQPEPSFLHRRDEVYSERLEDFVQRKLAHGWTQVSGFQPVHVEQA